MSTPLINQYYNQLNRAVQFSKSRNEDTIKSYFWMLLNDYAHKHNYEVVREVYTMGTKGSKVKPDGILKTLWAIEIGLWESKDEKDNIEEEISAKQKKGYPFTNILFEDSNTAILFQRSEKVMQANMRNPDELDKVLKAFVSYKNDTIYRFEDAIEKFKADIPIIVEVLRDRIDNLGIGNTHFITARNNFLELCKAEINPSFSVADIREMMIQHILTSDIFNKIFDDPEFHRHNTIASELEKIISVLFTYSERKNLLGDIEHYYETINATAASITDHHEKQKFLKVLYENFYKVYNPKAADRLGVVYTPNEIVQFMIKSTDYLLHKHFNKTLADKNVEILDPATGTGTFICDIIDHIPQQYLAHKYKNELHSNEVAILPYYISNLNIEFSFKQKMGYYEEFTNSCFVDTLDNVSALRESGKNLSRGIAMELGFALTSENAARIKRQNSKKISVVIGNPPYNANQQNENENNKNREYPIIDKRIKDTFIKNSNAQKTKVYDMYARFYRWAMDRVDQNGIIALITNRSFIDSKTFDGFRKIVQAEFDHCYIVDTKSDVRNNPKIAGTTHNVFGIQTGVAVMFLVKKENQDGDCRIEYMKMEDEWRKEIKLEWFRTNDFSTISFERIVPDKKNNWTNVNENNWQELLPLIDKQLKETIFIESSNGISTNRDEWVYDFSQKTLKEKISFFKEVYNKTISKGNIDNTIKWSRDLKLKLKRKLVLHEKNIEFLKINYRPFTKAYISLNPILVDVIGVNKNFFSDKNYSICINGNGKDIRPIGVDFFADLHFSGDTKCLPLYSFSPTGEKIDNITDWALSEFTTHYQNKEINKEDIFHYVYAILHNPTYQKEYELNLKRDLPRIPFYDNFDKWVKWGKTLMNLHVNYELVNAFDLRVHLYETKAETKKQKEIFNIVEESQALYAHQPKIKVKLKADKQNGIIEIDELVFLSGVPKEAWNYKLGNRSALEWVLDQYKEKKSTDPTIAEKFDTYKFADYKEQIIDLLKRVCTVSIETMKIIENMKTATS